MKTRIIIELSHEYDFIEKERDILIRRFAREVAKGCCKNWEHTWMDKTKIRVTLTDGPQDI